MLWFGTSSIYSKLPDEVGLNSLSLYKNLVFPWIVPIVHNERTPEVAPFRKGVSQVRMGHCWSMCKDFSPAPAVGLSPFPEHWRENRRWKERRLHYSYSLSFLSFSPVVFEPADYFIVNIWVQMFLSTWYFMSSLLCCFSTGLSS